MAVTDLVITDFAHEVIAWGHASSSTKELETLYKMDAHSFTAQIFVEFNSLPVQTSTSQLNPRRLCQSPASFGSAKINANFFDKWTESLGAQASHISKVYFMEISHVQYESIRLVSCRTEP